MRQAAAESFNRGRPLTERATRAAVQLALALACSITSVAASQSDPAWQAPSPSLPMPVSSRHAPAPAGFVSFCLRNPDQCESGPNAESAVRLTEQTWRQIEQVNSEVNRTIRPEDDRSHYGRAEYWTIPSDGRGDCEDIALTKRKLLLAAGFPARTLLIAVVITPRNIRHAVLTVVSDQGDYVLDNLDSHVKSWGETRYVWLERQDPATDLGWLAFETNAGTLAAAATSPAATAESATARTLHRE